MNNMSEKTELQSLAEMEPYVRSALVFMAVIETGSLAGTALALDCSGATVSTALKRFRDYSDLKLFTRTGRELVPTAEALDLAQRLRESFVLLHNVMVNPPRQQSCQKQVEQSQRY